jgi:hypothetical protein
MIVSGKTPPAVGHTMRKMLYQNDADLPTVMSMAHMTTSNGRYYRRVQFRRLVQLVKGEYMSRGIRMHAAKIERNLLEKASREFVALGAHLKERQMLTSRAARKQLFDQTYKKN